MTVFKIIVVIIFASLSLITLAGGLIFAGIIGLVIDQPKSYLDKMMGGDGK